MASLKRSFKDRAKEKLGFGNSRTKAQSVDSAGIGIMNPLSWDNLSSDIKEKLLGESISAKPNSLPETDLDNKMEFKMANSTESNEGLENNKKVKHVIIRPKGCTDYKVKNNDTLNSIAAQFDTTPSELCNINRLSTRFVFPGQTIYVPDKDYFSSASDSSAPTSPTAKSPPKHKPPDIPCIKQYSPIKSPPKGPGLAERILSPTVPRNKSDFNPPHPLSEEEAQRLDQECHERFIKLSVKHITDGQGVVSGVLLVTPNAIMFDPNVSDPLVIEHGTDTYGMIAPMDTVISVAMYHDIAAMKLKGSAKECISDVGSQKPEVYHSKNCPLYQRRYLKQQQLLQEKEKMKAVEETTEIDADITDGPPEAVPCPCIDNGMNAESGHDSDGQIRSQRFDVVQDEMKNFSSGETGGLTGVSALGPNSAQADGILVDIDSPANKSLLGYSEESQSATSNKSETGAEELSTHTNTLQAGAMGAGALDDNKLGKVRFRETTEDINACLETKEDDEELKVGSVESGIAEMLTEDGDDDDKCAAESPPPLTPHMQIGNIVYFQYGSVDAGEEQVSADESKEKADEIKIKPFPTEERNTTKEEESLQSSAATVATENNANSESTLHRSEPIPTPVKKLPTPKGSFSPLNFSPNFSSFVDFSSGLFSTSREERSKIKDITEVETVEPSPEMVGSMEDSQVLQTDGPRVITIKSSSGPRVITVDYSSNSTWYTKPFQIISDHVSSSISTSPGKIEDTVKSDKHDKHEKPTIELAVESAVKIEDKPELFQSIDELIPRPAKHYDDPPLYLCLKVGIPINKKVSGTCPIEAYSRKRKKPEYWFSIPREKVDPLYAFFIQWSPNLYGGEDEIDPHERGFVVIEDEDDTMDEEMHVDFVKGRITRSMSKDWEIVNVEEARRRLSILEVEDSLPLPELNGNTVILSEDHVRALSKKLPARAEGYPWSLIYSSDQNGFSLKTLYRSMFDYDTPILLVIKDTANTVFGAMTSCSLKYSDHFYGTGESFLYTFHPEFKVFNWTGENNFFIKGNKESLAIGAGKGSFGIWLDGDLYHGRTQNCDTYSNDPLTLQEDFIVKGFEAWGFV